MGCTWPAVAGEPESPFGPLVAQAVEEGYPGDIKAGRNIPYQGYYFRVLKAQGPNAPGGAKNYMEDGRMTGGFALVAWPASVRVFRHHDVPGQPERRRVSEGSG